MTIKIEKLPSGFYCVRVNGVWVDAASGSLEMAQGKAKNTNGKGID